MKTIGFACLAAVAGALTTVASAQNANAAKVFDEKVRGKTDKFALKFRKPNR